MFLELFYLQVTQKIIPPLQICVFPFPLTRKIHFTVFGIIFSPRLTDNLCQAVQL